MKNKKIAIKKHDDGIITYVIENDWIPRQFMDAGWGNGYIMLPNSHPLFGKHYNDAELCGIHGGWTFSEFDEFDGQEYWVFGFDTCHSMDTIGRWPEKNVIDEIESVVFYFQSLLTS